MHSAPETDLIAVARSIIITEAQGLANSAERIDESFVKVAQLLLGTPGKVFVTGSGTSGHIARRMAHLLAVCGTPAVYLQPMDALHGTMGAVSEGDVVIAISKGGGSSELNDLVSRVHDRGAKTVALTAAPESELANRCDIVAVVDAPSDVDPGGVIAMGSTLIVGAWGDALAYTLMRLRGYSWEAVLQTHPGGAVGQINEVPAPLPPLQLAE